MNKHDREIVSKLLEAYERATPRIDQALVKQVLEMLYPGGRRG